MKNQIILFMLILISFGCQAIAKAEDHSSVTPVIFGVYPMSLYDFDAKRENFKINFYAWWRTKDKDFHPEKSVEIMNAIKYKAVLSNRDKNGDEYYTTVHYYATIHQYWDPKNFPFDHQTLLISLEDQNDAKHVVFEPDYEQSGIHHEFEIPNWKILNFQLHKSVTHYNSNFGDISTPKGIYSRLTMQIDLKHEGWVSYFNYFIAFFVTSFLSLLVFFMEKESVEVKMLILVSAIFAFIGNKYVLDTVISDVAGYSLTNLIQVATFVALFCGIVFLLLDKNMAEKHYKKRVFMIHLIGYILACSYVVAVSVATYFAVIS